MSFESGAVTFRMFYVPGELQRESAEKFAKHTPPPIDTLGKNEINGWVTGQHLLDTNITEETAFVAGYLRLTLMKAERKIPPALLRAECKMEELAEMQARGFSYLKRTARSEIKRAVTEKLLPKMPPTLTGIDIVYDSRTKLLYASASSDKQIDALTLMFSRTTGQSIVPLTPGSAALMRKKIDLRNIDPTSFSRECEDELAENNIGRDFLTWLWFYSEYRGGIMSVDGTDFAVMIDGPLVFVHEGRGAHEMIVRKGSPLISAEAKTALGSGKKLCRAKVTLARDEEMWSVNLDADDFMMRSLKVPKGDAVDPIGRFQERMLMIDLFRETFLTFFDRFLEERTNSGEWAKTQADIQEWVATRKTMK